MLVKQVSLYKTSASNLQVYQTNNSILYLKSKMFISASLMFTIQLINWCQLSTVLGIGPVHEQIIHWWNKVSVQKPLKCTLNPSYLQPFDKQAKKYLDNLVWKPILFSEPCQHDDVNEEPYLYKGKQID